jgi:hypothetical protein
MLVMEPLGMSTRYAQQAGDGLFGNLHETGRRSDATAFIEMVDYLLRFGLRKLCVKQGGTASFRELLAAGTTAQQADTVVSIHLPDDEITGSYTAKQLAFSIDTG